MDQVPSVTLLLSGHPRDRSLTLPGVALSSCAAEARGGQ